MENASKALLMAGGILLGILILALMVTLFVGAGNLSKSYEVGKQADAIQNFNANFTKYLGKELTIHDVVTISNFALKNNVTVSGITVNGENIDEENYGEAIKADISKYLPDNEDSINKYKLVITEYYDDGYIKSIKFI